MSLALLDRAAGATMCDILSTAGPTLLNMGIWATGTGIGAKPGVAAMGLGAASLLAKNYLCEPIDVGSALVPEVDGCREVDGHGVAQIDDGMGRWFNPWAQSEEPYRTWSTVATKIAANFVEQVENGWERVTVFDTKEGQLTWRSFWNATQDAPPPTRCRILVTEGTCAIEGPGNNPPPPELYEPRPYYDVETDCHYSVTFQGFWEETPGSDVKPVLLIEGAGEQTRSSGARIGGCEFNPTIYVPDAGGGGTEIPGPPGPPGPPSQPGGDDVPWWWGPLLGGATGAALKLIGDELADWGEDALPGEFTLFAPCDKDEEGDPLEATWKFPKQSYKARVLAHQGALMEIMQQHLNWKTPVCSDEQPKGEGDWRTISFISTETSPYGKSRLRKRFRYRSTSGRELNYVVDHWRDFTWEAGPVCVKHLGSSWGTPQVWAASIDEGKRVIHHAAREAGIDPDQVGRWEVGGSSSSRLGVPGTMIVNTRGGYYWITARDGSNQRPLVRKTPHPGSGFDIDDID